MDDERCAGITRAGLQCRRPVTPWCHQHRPPSHALNFDAATERDEEPGDGQDTLFGAPERP